MATQLSMFPTPNVFIHNGKALTASGYVAQYFEKRHERVIDKIRNLDCSPEFTEHNFVLSEYTDSTGRKLPMYQMTKDGFMFLVMGFTGRKAARFKEAYIAEFNRMEKRLRQQQQHTPPATPSPRYQITLRYRDTVTGYEEVFRGVCDTPEQIIHGTAKKFGYLITEMF